MNDKSLSLIMDSGERRRSNSPFTTARWAVLPGLLATVFLVILSSSSMAAAITPVETGGTLLPPLASYGDSEMTKLGSVLLHRVQQQPLNLWTTLLFFGAILGHRRTFGLYVLNGHHPLLPVCTMSARVKLFTWLASLSAALFAAGGPARAEPPTNGTSPAVPAAVTNRWGFSASVYTYLVPDSRDYAQPTITADRDWLHLEARYNYENLETGSAWLGYNFSGSNTLSWELTPMLGGVFGNTTDIAPGYRGSLSWWRFALYSEGEYVVDAGDSSGSFFYNWSELTLAPVDWLRVGVVTKRTRAYHTDRDIQRGLLVGLSHRHLSFTTYMFNPDESRPVVVLALGVSF